MEEVLADHTGQPLERVSRDCDRDFIMGAEESVAYGMVDQVLIEHRPLVAPAMIGPSPAVPTPNDSRRGAPSSVLTPS